MGDFSSSTAAGNLRAALDEVVESGKEYTITVNYGGTFAKPGEAAVAEAYVAEGYGAYPHLICSHCAAGVESTVLDMKLETYTKELFTSTTADEAKVYTKLVNPDSYEKQVEICYNNASTAEAEIICLTGAKDLVK